MEVYQWPKTAVGLYGSSRYLISSSVSFTSSASIATISSAIIVAHKTVNAAHR